jgi:hypothetical protein
MLDFKYFLQITFVLLMVFKVLKLATLTLTDVLFLRKAASVDTFRFKFTLITTQNSVTKHIFVTVSLFHND